MLKHKKPGLLDQTPASQTLKKIGAKPYEGYTTIAQIIEDFHENGILLAIIFFALPVGIPLPYPPGFTTIMGLPLIILSFQMLCGVRKVVLPNRISSYRLKNSTLKSISNKLVSIVLLIEKYSKPRWAFAQSVYCEQLVGLCSLISSLFVALPLPFTNSVPALGISIMALGLLNRDGMVIIAGFLVAFIGGIISMGIVLASLGAIKYLFNFIF